MNRRAEQGTAVVSNAVVQVEVDLLHQRYCRSRSHLTKSNIKSTCPLEKKKRPEKSRKETTRLRIALVIKHTAMP